MNNYLDPRSKVLSSDEDVVEIIEVVEACEDYSDLDDQLTEEYEFDYNEVDY